MDQIRLSNTGIHDYPLCENGQTLVRFHKHAHLLMKVGKKRKSLYVDFWHRNQHYQRKLGVFPALSAEIFLREGDRIYRDVLNGGVLPTTSSLSHFFNKHYRPMIEVRNRSYMDDIQRFESHIHPVLGEMNMPDVRPIQIQKLLDKLAKTHAPATVNHVRTLLHRIYEVGIRYDFVNTNPVKKTERMVVDNVNNRILTPQEEERFIEVCLEELDNPSVACLLFSLCTGPRITNNCQVKWEDIDLENNTMLLEKTKTNKQHLLPLSDEAISILQKMQSQRAGPYVFSKDPSGLKPISYPRSVFTRLCKKAGISTTGALHNGREGFPAKPVTIHCLRKTNVSRLLQKYNDIYLCKEILGHSDIKVAGRYAFYLSEQLKRSVNGVIKLPMMELPPAGHSENLVK